MSFRAVVFGNSGSGKTTYAQNLADQHDCAHLDLDTIAWRPDCEVPTRRSLADSHQAIQAFIDQHGSWIIEGCYADLLALALPAATEVFFLNPGTATCIENARHRPWEPHKFASPAAQAAQLEHLVPWIQAYDERDDEYSLKAHRRLFDSFHGPKQEFTSNDRP